MDARGVKNRTLFDSCVWFETCRFNVLFVKDLQLETSATCMEDDIDMLSGITLVTRVLATLHCLGFSIALITYLVFVVRTL